MGSVGYSGLKLRKILCAGDNDLGRIFIWGELGEGKGEPSIWNKVCQRAFSISGAGAGKTEPVEEPRGDGQKPREEPEGCRSTDQGRRVSPGMNRT